MVLKGCISVTLQNSISQTIMHGNSNECCVNFFFFVKCKMFAFIFDINIHCIFFQIFQLSKFCATVGLNLHNFILNQLIHVVKACQIFYSVNFVGFNLHNFIFNQFMVAIINAHRIIWRKSILPFQYQIPQTFSLTLSLSRFSYFLSMHNLTHIQTY